MDLVKKIQLRTKGDAEVFAEVYRDKMIYDHDEKMWYYFDEHIWKRDTIKRAYNLIETVASAYQQLIENSSYDKSAHAFYWRRVNKLRDVVGVHNTLEMATAKMPLQEKWDDDPYLLAVKNGVIDLKTGELRDGEPNDYIRMFCDVEFKGLDEPALRWMQFLNEVFVDNPEIITFLQRMFGYAISGLSVEHILPVFFGARGRNGKDVMLTTLCAVLGEDFSGPISKEVLLSGLKNPGASAPFLYELQGKRLVYSDETSEGAGFDEAQVKMLSGGAPFVAKKLYQQPTIIYPEYIIVVTTNARPNVDANDDAIWERVILVEFRERFVDIPEFEHEHKPDKFLKDKLQQEKSGILAWLVKGFLEWQEHGLMIPDSVKYTTEVYRTDQDSLSRFIESECILDENSSVSATDLYNCYIQWANTDGTKKLNRREFSRKLKGKDFTKRRQAAGYFYIGLEIKPTIEDELESYLEMIQTTKTA